jgi:GT2 family glycosyltransferase
MEGPPASESGPIRPPRAKTARFKPARIKTARVKAAGELDSNTRPADRGASRWASELAMRPGKLRTAFQRIGARGFAGHVVDVSDLTRRYVVEILIDGFPAQIVSAHEYDHRLVEEGVGDGCYGFSFFVTAVETLSDSSVVEARIANAATPIGASIRLRDAYEADTDPFGSRGIRWVGGLRFCGWIGETVDSAPKVTAVINGISVAEAYPRSWRHLGSGVDDARAVPAFDIHLPVRFADGRVHSVRFLDGAGGDIPGSPLTFVAFDDGLERTLAQLGQIESERLRGQMFDRLLPNSMPMSQYKSWSERFPPPKPMVVDVAATAAVVFVGDGDAERSLRSLDNQSNADWVAAALPPNRTRGDFDIAQLRTFLEVEASNCDIVIFAICGMELESHAFETLVAAYRDFPQAVAIYGDLAVLGDPAHPWPIALPAFDYERMLEQGYCSYLFATRRIHVEQALTAGASNLYRLFNALVDNPVEARGAILHLPGTLAVLSGIDQDAGSGALAAATAEHLQRRGIAAQVTPRGGATFPAVRVSRSVEAALTSIIIPTRNRVDLLRRCLETIQPAVARALAEIIIVDNDSSDAEMLAFLSSIEGRTATIVRVPGTFNFSKLNNVAMRAAKGDYLCLLNNDIEALDDLWLDEMLGRLAEPDVGAVGATLLWPSGVIQHAGVVLGPNLGVAHAFSDRMQDDAGYADMLTVAHECSAVTAACLLTRKTDYAAVGGMDEIYFPVNFNDVDYCLKLRAFGKRIVLTPHARLLHLESASRGTDERFGGAARLQRELRTLRARWLEALVNDPYYSPLLSLDSIPFSALAWPPRAMSPRPNQVPQAVAVPSGM